MKYRKFGKLNWKVSVLGFGALRLPVIGEDRSRIDESEAIRIIRYAIDQGVNYIDTAYPYHGGNSEIVVGKALKDRYREKAKIATKMPIGRVDLSEDLDKIFNEQLKKLQTDHIDFYLLHGLNKKSWLKTLDLNVLDWAERLMDEGKIGYFGFSFHDEFEVFKEIIDGYNRWTFSQIQYNYLDMESSRRTPGTQGLKYASSKGLAVVVMEPIAGGLLVIPPAPEIQAVWDEAEIKRTPAEWALLWVWNHPEVSIALSGMSTMQQVIENLKTADQSSPNMLTEKELRIISKVREKYLRYGFIGCTGCRYCMPCPQGVSIPEILALYNEYLRRRGDVPKQAEIAGEYYDTIPPEKRAELCVKCGECEEKCSQYLPIRDLLTKALRTFERHLTSR